MADFVNTVDVYGDEYVMDAIIQRTITEFHDDTVTIIGSAVFSECINLTSVSFPNATSVDNLKSGHFYGSGLIRITPDTFPKITTVGYCYHRGFLANCKQLESIDWPSLTHLNSMHMFSGCSALKSVNLPNAVYKGWGGSLFYKCISLNSVNMPKLDVLNSNDFRECKSLVILDLPGCIRITGGYVFGDCNSMKALVLRSNTVCTLESTNSLLLSPFVRKTGYVYVPSALIEDYGVATNWSEVSDRFRVLEEYTIDGTVHGELDETKI